MPKKVPGKMPRIAWRRLVRIALIILAIVVAALLVHAWRQQTNATLTCRAAFGNLADQNGYFQVDLLRQHPNEQYFDAQVFVLYATSESPPSTLRLTLEASGDYARSIAETKLVPFGVGMSTPQPLSFGLPTPSISQRLFPFDSPTFDVSFSFDPPQRPKIVMVRNRTPDFIPACGTFVSQWQPPDRLRIRLHIQRNPFVQTTVVIVGIAALGFGLLLGQINKREILATATASYFLSLWSIRSIVAPSGVAYPTLLDFWLMGVSVAVLFVVAWRVLAADSTVYD
jgi:hypothetical protein